MNSSDIKALQFFLNRKGFKCAVDGDFGKKTIQALKEFQLSNELTIDGIFGNNTFSVAYKQGYRNANTPNRPDKIYPMSSAERAEVFGRFKYEASHELSDKDGIIIKGDWEDKNIKRTFVPQLVGMPMWDDLICDGWIRCHVLAIHQIRGLFQEWEDKGLIDLITDWGGCFNPRFMRGSRNLSNHSWGSAFDVNIAFNGLNKTPALVGETGSVRLLVEIAWKWGFYWGGHFSRLDGMHFELFKTFPY